MEDAVYITLKQKRFNENKDINVRKKRKKELKENPQREKNKRPEAIWSRLSCLKFFQIEELKSMMENLKNKGRRYFFSKE